MAREPSADRREKALARAAVLLLQGDLPRAAATLEAALKDAPDDDRILIKLAEVRRRQGRTADAVEIYLQAAAQHARRGFALRAVALLKQAHHLDPASPLVLEPLADRSVELGQPREALRYLEALADACERAGDRQRLQAALRRAGELAPESPAYPVRLAGHLAAIGQAAQAAELLARAAARFDEAGAPEAWLAVAEPLATLRPPDLAGRLRLARALLDRGLPKGALRHLQAALALDRRDAEVLALLLAAFEALGLADKAAAARRELEAVRAPAPPPGRPAPAPPAAAAPAAEDPVAEHLRKAGILVKYRELERALHHLGLAAAAAPEAAAPRLRLRDLLLALGRPVEAAREALLAIEALLREGRAGEAAAAVEALRAIEFGVPSPAAAPAPAPTEEVELVALVEEEVAGEPASPAEPPEDGEVPPAFGAEEILARFREGVARVVRPEDAATHHDLGIAFFEMELFQEALEAFEAARAADPSRQGDCLTMIGRCRLGLGEAGEAVTALERAIVEPGLAPEARADAYAHLAAAHEAAGDVRAALLHLREARRLAPHLAALAGRLDRLAAALAPPAPAPCWEVEPTPSAA